MFGSLIKRSPGVLLAVACTIVFGAVAYATLPRESAPDVKIPVVMVTTVYTGVSPADIESLISIPLENELAGVKDLKKMTSNSAEGVSIVSLEFEPEVVIEEALQLVRDGVDKAQSKLPADAEDPAVREISLSDVPILLVTIAGPVDESILKTLGERLQDESKRIPGVLDATLSGGRDRQIRVEIDPRRLAYYGFSLGDVNSAIEGENVNIPGGDITAGSSNYLVRVPGDFKTSDDVLNVPIKRKGDRPVFVRDVARVVDDYAPSTTYARMDGQRAVTVGVTKRAGANIIDISDALKVMVQEHSETWPAGVEYRLLADQSKQIRDMVSELENNIFTALILVVGILFVFLGVRTSLFVAVAIPLSMLLSFILIDAFGMTLNMVVLFSLILALGMLVDNGIVIVENIYRHAEEGKDRLQASIDGTAEVALAVTASTATTVAAFLPLVFWTGIMGQFMSYLPKTVIIVLISSLVVALIVLPVTTAIFMPRNPSFGGEVGEPGRMMRAYRALLRWSIEHRYASALGVFGILVGSLVAYGALNHGTEFFPETEPNRATVAVRAPDGTDLEQTDRLVRRVEGVLAQLENIDVYVAETGISGTGDPMAGSNAANNQARITVDFLPSKADAKPGQKIRIESTTATIDTIRNAVAEIPGARVTVEKERMGPPVGSPIAVEVAGEDFETVGELAQALRRRLGEVPGATDLTDNYKVGRPEMTLRIDRGAANRVGASTRDIATAVRTAVAGTKVSTLRDGDDEYDIVVTLDPRYTEDMQSVLDLRIPGREDTSPDKFAVPLASVAWYELTGGSGAIARIDQDLVITIQGDVAEGFNENTVRAGVNEVLAAWTGPVGYTVRLGGANDEQQAAGEFLARAFLLAVFLIALVLVSQFNGFSRPAIVMAAVVLSLVGVLWGLIITGTPFGIMMTGIGIISLAGVVVNNAIVLLDYVEQLREQGMSQFDALMKAGMTRFRPVMLTAATTILGLVPMAMGWSVDVRGMRLVTGGSSAQFWGPMAVAVIFGLAFATLLTLVMVPTMYSIVEDLLALPGRLMARLPSRRAAAAATTVVALLLVPALASAETVTLQEAWSAALSDNLDLRLAGEQTEIARAQRGLALSSLSPTVNVSGSFVLNEREIAFDPADMMPAPDTSGLEDSLSFLPEEQRAEVAAGFSSMFDTGDSEPIVMQQKQYVQAGLTLRQTLFSGSALPGLLGNNRLVEAAQLDEARARQQIRLQVAASYLQVLLARRSQAVSEAGLALAEAQLQQAESQVAAGLMPRRALLQAQLAVATSTRDLRSLGETVVQAEQALQRATGLDPSAQLVQPESFVVPASLVAALTDSADRPDRAAAERRSVAMGHNRTGWLLQWAPRLDATFNLAYNPNSGFNDDKTPWYLAISANWDVWDGGARNARIREAGAQLRMAELQQEQVADRIEEEVRVNWERLAAAEESLTSLDAELALAQENLLLAQRQLEAGQATWLEVDTARLQLQSSELSKAQAQATRELRAAELLAATGGL